MEQKTWSMLLGDSGGAKVVGNTIVQPNAETGSYRIVWKFETPEQAQIAFKAWREGR